MKICPTCDRHFEEDLRTCPDDGATLLVVHDPSQEQEERLIGQMIEGRYRIDSKLGAGGMGAVFRGTQTAVGREVAIKVLAKDVATDVNAVKRFMQEAKAASALSHPNTITIHDFGQTADGLLYLVMELVSGETLSAVLRREGAMRPSRAVRIVGQILNALQEAHGIGIIHRDLKPENVIVSPRSGNPDFLKVLDFGLAKLTEGDGSSTGLTQTGQVFGTPGYMSPEQARGEVCDLRSDLYSVGVMLYEMLSGRRPFDGDNPLSVLVKHIQEAPPDFITLDPPVDVPPGLRAVVFKTLAKGRDDRFDSAAEMHQALLHGLEAAGIEATSFTGPVHPAAPASSPSVRSVAPASSGLQKTLGSGIMGQVSLPDASLPPDAFQPPKSKAPLFAGLAALLLVGGGVGAWQAGVFGGEDPQPAPAATSEGSPARVQVPATAKVEVQPEPEAAAAPEPEPQKPAEPARVVVEVKSDPPGAAVRVEVLAASGKKMLDVEKTPASVEVPEGAWLTATFNSEGYKEVDAKVQAREGAVLNATLEKEKPRWRPKPKQRVSKRKAPPPEPPAVAGPAPAPEPKPKPQPKPRATAIDDLK